MDPWRLFARHHYLSGSLAVGARCYLATWNGEPVTFCATLPVITKRNHRRFTRIVTLPDYQGMGIGMRVVAAVASLHRAEGLRINVTSSHPALIRHCRRSPDWKTVNVKKTRLGPTRRGAVSRVSQFGRPFRRFVRVPGIMSTAQPLTEDQRKKLCGVIILGCDRLTACHFVDATVEQLQADLAPTKRSPARWLAPRPRPRCDTWATSTAPRRTKKTGAPASGGWSAWPTSPATTASPPRRICLELVDRLARVVVENVADAELQRRLVEQFVEVVSRRFDDPEATPAASGHGAILTVPYRVVESADVDVEEFSDA